MIWPQFQQNTLNTNLIYWKVSQAISRGIRWFLCKAFGQQYVYNLIILLPGKKMPVAEWMCDISTCQDIIFFHPNSNMPLLHFASSHEPSRKNIFFLEEKVNLMICREHISNMPTQKIQISYYKHKYKYPIIIKPYLQLWAILHGIKLMIGLTANF